MKTLLLILAAMLTSVVANAQNETEILPRKVSNLTLTDLNGQPAELPYWGDKNVLIFYVDPDAYINGNDTAKFAKEIEDNKRAAGPAIEGFGVMNFPDASFPKGLVRAIARKRTEKNKAVILEDNEHAMLKSWGLGDCNGKFLLIIVNREGEMVYIRREPMDKEGKEEFYRVVSQYTH